MESKIEEYIDEIFNNNDTIAIDILLTYTLWLTPISDTNYNKNEKRLKTLFRRVINRSLNLKNFKKSDVKKKINNFINFENSFGKGGFYSLKDSLYTYLFNKISNQSYNLKEKLKNVDEIDKEIIDFLFYRISKSINDRDSWSGFSEYAFNDEGEVLKVDTENWASEFNII